WFGAFTRGGGDADPDSADACAEPAGASASGYEAHQAARLARAHVGDGCRARGDVHARAVHAEARGRAPRRGADKRQCPSATPRPGERGWVSRAAPKCRRPSTKSTKLTP